MPFHGPYTPSDLAEPDDFVQVQLLLENALRLGFRCDGRPTTVFRDNLLGLGLLRVEVSREGPAVKHRVLQALCRRDHDHAQWRVTTFLPAPRWMAYTASILNANGELGVSVKQMPLQDPGEALRPDGALLTTIHSVSFLVAWDVPDPSGRGGSETEEP